MTEHGYPVLPGFFVNLPGLSISPTTVHFTSLSLNLHSFKVHRTTNLQDTSNTNASSCLFICKWDGLWMKKEVNKQTDDLNIRCPTMFDYEGIKTRTSSYWVFISHHGMVLNFTKYYKFKSISHLVHRRMLLLNQRCHSHRMHDFRKLLLQGVLLVW